MASSYLLKKARERAEEIDKEYGEDSYGGTKWLESQKQKTAEKKNEVTTETGGRTAGSVASNYLRDKAKAQQLRVSREYGTGAYGGIGNADRDGYTDFVRAASELRLDPNRYARTDKEEEADVTDTEKEKSPWWDIALEMGKYGFSSWNKGVVSTLDALTPEFTIGGKTIDPFRSINELYTSENERYRQQMEDSLYGRGQAARIAAEIGAGTIAAVPDAIPAVLSWGTSLLPALGKPASGFLNSARTALTNLAKNPNFWLSFMQTYGTDYEEMKALGANDFVAESAALVSSLLNAGIEVGGGIETLPARLKNGNRNQILQWALSLPEEGLEEVFQDIVTNVTKKGLVDPDKKWFSMNTEDDAVINPIELVRDFGMGTAVGALLGGAQVGTVSALNAGANAANTKRVSDLGSKYQVLATKTIEEGLSFPENTQAYKTAKEVSDMLSRDGQVSDYDLGRVVIATEQAIRAEENASDTVIGADAQEGDTETQETLSRLAVETVADKAGTSQEAVQSKSEGIADSGRKTNIPYNVLADKQESAKPSVRRESMAEWTGYGENGVRAFNAALERDGSVTPEQMRVRFQSAYEAGLANVPKESVVQSLSDDIMTDAYLAGRQDYVASLQKAPAVSTAGKDSGFDSTGAPKDVSKWEVETVDTLLRSLGVKGSWTNDDRYNARIKGSSIEFSTTFQRNVGGEKRSIVFYAAHEAGMHRLMQLAPTEGRAFINELYRYIGKDRPSTLETLAEEKQAAYKEQNVSLSTEGAMEEISADSIMSLYKNEEEFRSAIEKVANGKNETAKKGLARFREILSDIVEKLRNAISRLTGKDRAEAQKTLDDVEHLRSLYETALRAAVSKNRELESSYTDKRDGKLFRSRDANGTVTLETSVGNPVAQMQENGSAQLSLKTYREFGRAELSKWLEKRKKSGLISKEDASDILTKLDEYYELCQNFKNKYAPFGAWSDAGVVTDAKGKPVFSVIKKNGEYAMNLDFSLVCKKRRTLDAVFGEMIRRGLMDNVDLGEADISRINDIIRESGFETACALCFVDAKRYRQAGVADTFVNKYNDIVRMMLPEDGSVSAHHFDFVGTGNFRDSGTGLHTLTNAQLKDGISKLRGVMRENGSATVPYKIAKHLIENPQDRRLVSRGEFMNTDGFEAVKLKNPSILRLYNSSKGAGGPKASFSDVQYLGDVMKKSGFTPEKAYAVGGVRIQSFSDYVPRLVFDYIQMTGDLAAKNLPAHAYTKEAMFAKQFGMTGVKINLSLVPAVAENGVAPGLDANGDYLWYDGQSFGSDVNVKGSGKTGFDSAVEIQNAKGYDKNCGTIAVGISDEQIQKMLDDPDIRMIIPYHKSSLNPIVAAMNKIDRYKDYTDTQNTRQKDTGTKITGKEFNFNEALRRTGDAKAATNEYLAWCEKNGYIPKFEQFSGHENYYKLLEDFSTYDSSGASSPQAAVTMTFPTDADAFGSMASLIEQGLEEDAILEARREKGVPEIVDKIEKVLKKKEEYADNSKQAEKERIELSDANTRFSLKTEPPEKTLLAWKVFKVKRSAKGSLFPPMVDTSRATPVGDWMRAKVAKIAMLDENTPYRNKYGRLGVMQGTGNKPFVTSDNDTLYLRPGWHLGDYPLGTQFDKKIKDDSGTPYMQDDMVWALCEISADTDYQDEADMMGLVDPVSGRYDDMQASPQFLPENGYYKYKTNKVAKDSVPWYITDKMRVVQLINDDEMNDILDSMLGTHRNRAGGVPMSDEMLASYGFRTKNLTNDGVDYLQKWKEQVKNLENSGLIDAQNGYFYFFDRDKSNANGYINVTKSKADAASFRNMELIKSKNGASVFREGQSSTANKDAQHDYGEFCKKYGLTKNPSRGQSTESWVNDILDAARKEGFDIFEFKDQSNIGTFILNEDSVNRDYKYNNASGLFGADGMSMEYEKRYDIGGEKYSLKDSTGKSLSDDQEKYFRLSSVRDRDGLLVPVYHATLRDFTVFDRKKLGENTDGFASSIYTEASSHVGFFFNTQDLSKDEQSIYDRSVKCYLNIENPYDTYDLNGFANAIEEHGEGEDASEIGASFAKWLDENGYDGVSFYDNEFGGTTYVALYPEQIKNVDNKRPSSDPDINLSKKTDKDLVRENEKLKEVNRALREQFKITKFAKVDKKSLDKFARSLLNEYHSSADVEETRDSLDALYTYMANGEYKNPPVWEDLFRSAYDVAESILTNASVTDTEMYDEYKGLRDYLRTTGISIDKQYENDIPGYENLSEFRRANFGRIKLVNDGLPIDTAYQELSSMYPEFFDEDKTSNPADQLSRIAEVLDTLKPMEINPYTDDMRRSATWVANDILDRFFNLPQAKPTYADKAAKKLAETKYRDRVRLEELRAEKNAKIAELIDENRKKVKEARKEGMRKRDEAVKLLQDRYNAKQEELSEARRASALQEKIERHARQLSQKLLNPTDKQHIPEVLRKPVAKVLDAINMESAYTIDPKTGKRNRNKDGDPVTRTLAFADLRAAYQKIMQEDGSDIVVDPEMSYMLDLVIKMRDVKLSNMMPSQLEAVWNVVRSLEHTISLSGKILSTMKYAKTVDLANAMVESTETRRVMRGRDIEDIRLALENPYTFFSHYGEAGKEIYRMLRNAQDEQQIMTNDVRDKVGKIVDEKTVSKLEREVHEFKTERGDSLTLTKAHIMDIYLLSRREQAQEHLMQGGIVQPEVKNRNIKRGTDAILLSIEDIQNIIRTLNDSERKIAERLQELTRTTLAGYGNSSSLRAYGYKKFTGEDYWPIKSAKEGVHSNVENGTDNTRSIKNIGLAKSVVLGANNPLDIGGVFSTFASHAADMIDYAAWLCPMEDANRLYNFRFKDDSGSYTGKSIKGILNRYGGKNADKYWHRLMEDIQNGIKPVSDNAISQKVGRMIGNARGAAVGANIRVVIQQPTAIIRALMVLNPSDMIAGLAKGGGWKTALKYSAIAQRKDIGGFDMSSPSQMKSILFGGDTKLQKFNEVMMAGASAADAVTWGRIWNACENAVKRKNKTLTRGSNEFYQAVDELFTEVIDQTQVVDGVLQRSQAMRSSDSWMNQATAFMGEPTMSMNMLLRAYQNFAGEQDSRKRGAAMRKFGRAAFALIATNTVNALAQSFVDAWRDDEDDEYWDKFWKAFTGIDGSEESAWDKAVSAVLSGNFGSGLNPVGYLPVAKDILSLLQGYDVSRADADVMSDIINAAKQFTESLKDGKKTVARASIDLSKQVAKVFGISLPNIERDVIGIMRQIAFETGNTALQYEMEKWTYKIGNEKNKNRFEDILYKAYSEDRVAYDHIRSDLLKNGFTGDELDAAINSRKEKTALSGTGYESAKEAYDALYSMKQSGRTDSYDQLRRTLLEASYTDIDGRNEQLFTEKNIESAMQTRRVNEGIQSMGYSSKDGVYDAMYESIRNDDMTEYYKKVVSMMGLGVDASDIESAMRTRAKADGLSVSDLTKALASGGFKPKFETESADTFDIDDLSTDEYTTYSGEYGDMIDRLMDDFAKRGFDALSPEDANKWLGSAYSYAKETALEIATDGEYDSDTKWINDAQQAEKNGISVSDYIITKDAYGSSVADKLYDAKKNGISVDQYQEYRDMLDKYDEPNENGNLGSYTSAERVKAISAVDGLGDREIAFLWDTDQGYEALSYGIDMNKYIQFKAAQENIKADKDKNGNSISGSRREKIEDYLNSMGLSYKEYLYLLGTEYSTVKKNKDYIEYFG